MNFSHPADYRFDLAFVVEPIELCAIESLTRGEALWMAHHIFKLQSHWFVDATRKITRESG